MELSPANQAALLLRFNVTFPGESFQGWNHLPFTKQQYWQSVDPQAAAVAAGQLSAEQHASLLMDGLSPELPSQVDERAVCQQELAEAAAQLGQRNAALAEAREQREQFQRAQNALLNGNAHPIASITHERQAEGTEA